MRDVALLQAKERDDLFRMVAAKKGLQPAIIEKDFWVCWMLDYLFSYCKYRDKFVFKGGTSLSKAFNLIERFSEDIDLVIDWRVFDYKFDEPWEKRSNTKQDAFIELINGNVSEFLLEKLKPIMEEDFIQNIVGDWRLSIHENDPQTLCFDYPRAFNDSSILQELRLETGALAAWAPAQVAYISSYVAELFPEKMQVLSTPVLTVSPERTFWEKVTILHKEAKRTNGRLPARYSRHYYDIYCMCQTIVKSRALANLELLEQVVKFKVAFWRSNAARYDLCKPGTIRLVPPDAQAQRVRDDYAHMRNMLFGKVPNFDEIIESIYSLENEINAF